MLFNLSIGTYIKVRHCCPNSLFHASPHFNVLIMTSISFYYACSESWSGAVHFAKLKKPYCELDPSMNNEDLILLIFFFTSLFFFPFSLPPHYCLVLLSFLLQLPEHTVPYLLETVSRCISPTFFLWHKYIFMWWLSNHAALHSTSRDVILPMWNAFLKTSVHVCNI